MTYLRRGQVRYLQGRHKEALQDFEQAERANERGLNNDFIHIWQGLAEMRLDQDPRQRLEGRLKNADSGRWPVPILQFLAGRARSGDVMRAAEDSAADERAANLCEAYFYLAMVALIKGSAKEGEELLRKTIDTGVVTYMEYDLAQEVLRASPR